MPPTVLLAQNTEKKGKSKKSQDSSDTEQDTATAATNEATEETQIETSTETTKSFAESLSGFDLANPTWDAFVVLFFIVSALLYGISLGRDRIIVILVSIYMSLAVVHALPDFVLNIQLNDGFAFQITAFIAVFVVLFFLISRSALARTLGVEANNGRWYQTIVFSILHVGLLISITMSFMPITIIQKFAPLTQTVFTHEWAVFGWIVAPIIAMIFFGRHSSE